MSYAISSSSLFPASPFLALLTPRPTSSTPSLLPLLLPLSSPRILCRFSLFLPISCTAAPRSQHANSAFIIGLIVPRLEFSMEGNVSVLHMCNVYNCMRDLCNIRDAQMIVHFDGTHTRHTIKQKTKTNKVHVVCATCR